MVTNLMMLKLIISKFTSILVDFLYNTDLRRENTQTRVENQVTLGYNCNHLVFNIYSKWALNEHLIV